MNHVDVPLPDGSFKRINQPEGAAAAAGLRSWRKRPCRWVYGVTTVPEREHAYLPRTLKSLAAAGFDAPRLFVDGTEDPRGTADRLGFDREAVVGRWPRIGAYCHWLLSLSELVMRGIRSGAAPDLVAVFQDDFVTCRGLREYLERCRPPDKGYWNLLTFPENQAIAPSEGGWFRSDQRGLGAVALVFTLEAAVTFLSQKHAWERMHDPSRGNQKIDGGVVEAMHHAGWMEFCHSPSLVFHTGARSAIGNGTHPDAPSFVGEDADARNLCGMVK